MNRLRLAIMFLALAAPLAACVVVEPPRPRHAAVWVPGHYGPGGGWIPGHWR